MIAYSLLQTAYQRPPAVFILPHVHILYFPVTIFFYFMIPLYKITKIRNREDLYLIYGITFLLMFFLTFIVYYSEMILIEKWEGKVHIFGLFNSIFFSIAQLISTIEEVKHDTKNNVALMNTKDNTNMSQVDLVVNNIQETTKLKIG